MKDSTASIPTTYSIAMLSRRNKYNDPIILLETRDAYTAWSQWRTLCPDLPDRTILSVWNGVSAHTLAVRLTRSL